MEESQENMERIITKILMSCNSNLLFRRDEFEENPNYGVLINVIFTNLFDYIQLHHVNIENYKTFSTMFEIVMNKYHKILYLK